MDEGALRPTSRPSGKSSLTWSRPVPPPSTPYALYVTSAGWCRGPTKTYDELAPQLAGAAGVQRPGSKNLKSCPRPPSCPWRQARCPCGRLLGPPSWASLIKVGVKFLSWLPVLPLRCPTGARLALAKTKGPPDVDAGSRTGHQEPPPTRGLLALDHPKKDYPML